MNKYKDDATCGKKNQQNTTCFYGKGIMQGFYALNGPECVGLNQNLFAQFFKCLETGCPEVARNVQHEHYSIYSLL